MSLSDAFNGLSSTPVSLACNDASLHDRLKSATAELTKLKEEDFPPQFQEGAGKLFALIHDDAESGDRPEDHTDIALAMLGLHTDLVAFTGRVRN
jgi:hypothetical protein